MFFMYVFNMFFYKKWKKHVCYVFYLQIIVFNIYGVYKKDRKESN